MNEIEETDRYMELICKSLVRAARNGNYDRVKGLLDFGARYELPRTSRKYDIARHEAVLESIARGHEEIAGLLWQDGAGPPAPAGGKPYTTLCAAFRDDLWNIRHPEAQENFKQTVNMDAARPRR